MKKSSHKNGIVITALALMIIAAGYLNFTGQKISTNGITARETSSPDVTSENTADISAEDIGGDSEESSDEKKEESSQKESSQEDSEYTITDSGEVLASEENPGEAVMVSNNIGSDYFASSKLNREQTRAKNKETLMNIINDDKIASSDKKSAIKQVAAMTKVSEKENAAELMLQAKGFENAMVSISDGNADVIVSSEGLTNQQIAQIEDIVKRKTGITADKIVITPVNVK